MYTEIMTYTPRGLILVQSKLLTTHKNCGLAVLGVESLTTVHLRPIAAINGDPDIGIDIVQSFTSVRFHLFTHVHGIKENDPG